MAGLADYLKKNARFAYGGGILGAPFLIGDIKGILDADNKWKALLKTMKDFLLVRVAMVGFFTAAAAGVKALVRETGALDAAFKRLGQNQFVARGLQAFLGGISAARQRVAQLNVLSSRGPFRFEQVAEANKSLEIFTRGAYSSVQATQQVGQAAIATGNNIEDVAKEVGMFYDQLHNGQPVNQTTETLRQMGVISEQTAEHLNSLAQGSENAATSVQTLQDALVRAGSGAEGYQNDLANITEAHKKALEEMKAAFGAPFVESEAKNIKNYTSAMKAFTPTLAEIARSLAIVYNGFSTAASSLAKWIAGSKNAQSAAKILITLFEALTVVAVAFGTTAAIPLTRIILSLTSGLIGMGGAATVAGAALRGIALAGVWGAVAVAVAGVVGMFINMRQELGRAAKEHREWVKSNREATAAILAEAAAVKTLAERNASLAKILERVGQLQKDQHEDTKKTAEQRRHLQLGTRLLGTPFADPFLRQKESLDKFAQKRQRERQSEKEDLVSQANQLTRIDVINEQLIQADTRRRVLVEEQTKGQLQLDKEGFASLEERRRVNNANAESTRKQFAAEQKAQQVRASIQNAEKLTNEQRDTKIAKLFNAESDVTDAMKEQQKVALSAQQDTAVRARAEAERYHQAGRVLNLEKEIATLGERTTPERRAELQIQLQRAKALSKGVQYSAAAETEAETRARVLESREEKAGTTDMQAARIQRFEVENDIRRSEAVARGDVRAVSLSENLGKFVNTFQQLEPMFGAQQAIDLSRRKTEADILEKYASQPAVVSSLQAVGGGGNVSQAPVLGALREIKDLNKAQLDVLNIIAGTPDSQPGQATFAP